ncbi:hypothetical protein PQR15_11600 [Streptomyces lydicus]|nr:hypothetical protein [Streptomyces lydicus]
MSHAPARPAGRRGRHAEGLPRPFDRPAESHVPGRWAATGAAHRCGAVTGPGAPAGRTPSWAAPEQERGAGARVMSEP